MMITKKVKKSNTLINNILGFILVTTQKDSNLVPKTLYLLSFLTLKIIK
ncbi:hypothetical protein SAMN05428642_103203 [Flaviramulus basaltis]|uniref:Uncharacterized protein n=1 Tax=Flaviramulus basaltis TaxID=369401 RepID=A0A1K2IMY0_9FLAO|nr:hypothetical protein SAMN05428642_103203 [Flaviramulus basaltis]